MDVAANDRLATRVTEQVQGAPINVGAVSGAVVGQHGDRRRIQDVRQHPSLLPDREQVADP